MPLDFPSSPVLDETYSVGSRTWKYNGVAWEQISTTVGPTGPTGPAGSGGGGAGELTSLNWYIQGRKAEGVTYDSDGYSYSVFNYQTESPTEPLTLVKTSPDGSFVFKKQFGGGTSAYIGSLHVDSNKNIYVGVYNSSLVHVLKLDNNADLIWQKAFSLSYNDIFGIKSDSLGNIYVITGQALIKLNSSGVQQYIKGISPSSFYSYSIEVDSSNNLILVGSDYTNNPDVGVIIKYDSDGDIIWQQSIEHPMSVDLLGLTLDQVGNMYISGSVWDSPSRAFVIKYNSSGTLQWKKEISADGATWTEGHKISCDEYLNIYMIGATSAGTTLYKISDSGSILWQKNIPNSYPTASWYSNNIDVSDESVLFSTRIAGDNAKHCVLQLFKSGNFNNNYGLFEIADQTSTVIDSTITSSTSSLVETTPSITVSSDILTGPNPSIFEHKLYRIFPPGLSVAAPEYVTLGPGGNTQNLVVNVVQGSLENSSGFLNLAIGANALKSATTGYWNTAIGYDSVKNLTTGSYNLGLGPMSLQGLTTGSYNVAIGNGALSSNSTGGYNVAIGSFALSGTKGSNDIGIGYLSFPYSQQGGNIGIGSSAGASTVSASNNIAIGHNALYYQRDVIITYNLIGGSGYTDGTYTGLFIGAPSSGSLGSTIYNATVVISGGSVTSVTYENIYRAKSGVVFEFYSGQIPGGGSGFQYIITGTTYGSSNLAIGHNSLYSLSSASYNTAIGLNTGFNITTGNENVLIGYGTGDDITTGSGNIVIGTEASTSSPTTSNEITLGANAIKSFRIPGLNVEWKDGQGTLSINSQSSSNYDLILTDSGKLVEMNNASANTITIPLESSINFAIGTQINILQAGTGQTTIQGESGVTVNGTPGLKLRAQWSYATIIKRGANNWVVIGDISV